MRQNRKTSSSSASSIVDPKKQTRKLAWLRYTLTMMRKRYTPAQKAAIVLEFLKEEDTLPQIAARHGVHPNLLCKWKTQALEGLPNEKLSRMWIRRTKLSRHTRLQASHPAHSERQHGGSNGGWTKPRAFPATPLWRLYPAFFFSENSSRQFTPPLAPRISPDPSLRHTPVAGDPSGWAGCRRTPPWVSSFDCSFDIAQDVAQDGPG